jgi:hypothetical protein
MRIPWSKAAALVFITVSVGLLAATESVGQGITVALTPTVAQVAPGEEFDLDISVTQAGLPFNGFDAVIAWDPAALSPISNQEGGLMADACGDTFHRFRQGADTDTITDVLLCNGIDLTGPGQIYRLRFRASDTAQETHVAFIPGLQFYDAGLFVNPVISMDATINIGPPVSVEDPPTPSKLRLQVAPNPCRSGTLFTIEADRAGPQRLRVIDARGRVVRRFEEPMGAAGARTVAWDGCDQGGRPLSAGVYFVTLEVVGRSVSNRVSLVR